MILNGPLDDRALAAFDVLVGDARIVGLGESAHCQHEFYVLRNQLIAHLVEEHGFTAVLMESGLVEGLDVNQFLATGTGDLEQLLRTGFTYGMGACEEMRDLLTWMRSRNAERGANLEFWGIDSIAGQQTPRPGLDRVWAYLEPLAPEVVERSRPIIDDVVARFEGPHLDEALARYRSIDAAERDLLSTTIGNLVLLFADREPAWTKRTSRPEFTAAARSAELVRQFDELIRSWAQIVGTGRFQPTANRNVRDRFMADNVEWILGHLGPSARVIVLAHNAHLLRSELAFPFPDVLEATATPAESASMTPLGTFLEHRHGTAYRPVALTSTTRTIVGPKGDFPSRDPPQGSLERALASRQGSPVIDLRANDIAVMGVDHMLSAPMVIDIERTSFDGVIHLEHTGRYDTVLTAEELAADS